MASPLMPTASAIINPVLIRPRDARNGALVGVAVMEGDGLGVALESDVGVCALTVALAVWLVVAGVPATGTAVPAPALIITVIRTALEDHTLREELPGYRDYAGRVRYRLFPWIY